MRDYRELVKAAEDRGDRMARALVENGAPLYVNDSGITDLLEEADALPGWAPGDAASDVRAAFRCSLENTFGDLLFS